MSYLQSQIVSPMYEPNKQKRMVKLWFCDVDYAKAFPSYMSHIFYANPYGQYNLPMLGEYIEVSESAAIRLQAVARHQNRPLLLTAEQGGDRIAELIKKAIQSGQDLDSIDLSKAYVLAKSTALSDEEVLEIARQRGLLAQEPQVATTKPVSSSKKE